MSYSKFEAILEDICWLSVLLALPYHGGNRLVSLDVLSNVFSCGIRPSRLRLKRARVLLVYLYTLLYLFQQPQAIAGLAFAKISSNSFISFISSIITVADMQVFKKSVNQRLQSSNIAALTN